MARVHVFITGDVIGVGFRYWAAIQAKKLGLTGWVKNVYQPQKQVEAVFEGDKDKVQEVVELCKKGPEVSWVENAKITWEEPRGEFDGFKVIK